MKVSGGSLDGVHSEHFTAAELACKHCGVNRCRQGLVNALEDLRAIASRMAFPDRPATSRRIFLDCAYRCEIHNAQVGGVPNSEHVEGIAADLKIEGMTVREMYQTALLIPAFKGIGVDERRGYIHVDTRHQLARWTYNEFGKPAKWDLSLDSHNA